MRIAGIDSLPCRVLTQLDRHPSIRIPSHPIRPPLPALAAATRPGLNVTVFLLPSILNCFPFADPPLLLTLPPRPVLWLSAVLELGLPLTIIQSQKPGQKIKIKKKKNTVRVNMCPYVRPNFG